MWFPYLETNGLYLATVLLSLVTKVSANWAGGPTYPLVTALTIWAVKRPLTGVVESPVVLFIRVFSRKHTKRPNSTNLNLIRRGGCRAVKLSTGGGERTERRRNLNPVPEAHIWAVYVSPGT